MIDRETEALRLRYKALSDDWNRIRDRDQQWLRFERRVGWAAAIILLVGAIAGLVA
jgi:hypothetical protein